MIANDDKVVEVFPCNANGPMYVITAPDTDTQPFVDYEDPNILYQIAWYGDVSIEDIAELEKCGCTFEPTLIDVPPPLRPSLHPCCDDDSSCAHDSASPETIVSSNYDAFNCDEDTEEEMATEVCSGENIASNANGTLCDLAIICPPH